VRHISITCPNCKLPERGVAHPDSRDLGHSGAYYCFGCKQHGTFQIVFTPAANATGSVAPPAAA
jgi:hypothetical protein